MEQTFQFPFYKEIIYLNGACLNPDHERERVETYFVSSPSYDEYRQNFVKDEQNIIANTSAKF